MIYCVEDDDSIRELMLYTLKASGFQGRGFPEAAEFWQAIELAGTGREPVPRLIMLDIMLPGEDGISILQKLRANAVTARVPVIMATAKGTEYDKVKGLDLGADDYLAKPFGMMEMISRIKAVLRRSEPKEAEHTLLFGGVVIDLLQHTVTIDGKLVEMPLKEFELLKLFMENPGMAFSRDKLLSRIWDTDYMGESRTVDVHISSLRTRLGEWGSAIKTVRSVGYRLEVPHA
ncbi:MAG: winged helix-turn-helix domain-containing protein [Anaerovibrio sp.]|uniref:winged helix-turn-helix domain-containing protein n=1 Tax=Anaerovibrio sp. TaxID=1872532 RepID=UPI0026113838|nr:winged helix-turn-helix domain-containing protein [Anaerovibrio sp.]MDD7677164.1 winged helix-turn-helix domain-containing protein [Anaerovibrio sp.]MDY2602981.1 winged helix-turn-helix domain-containing protein [Anaerovibrio sp.]